MTDALFEVTPQPRLQPGERVVVDTMWGAEEFRVVGVCEDAGFPMVTLSSVDGADTITVNVARARRVES